jgi:hypothetical protein
MNIADPDEVRRLVAAALASGRLRGDNVVAAAAVFLVTGRGFVDHGSTADWSYLDFRVDDLLFGHHAVVHLKHPTISHHQSYDRIYKLFPKP